MTADAFIATVQKMLGLSPLMVEHLISLAPDLTEKKRADALKEILPVNDEIVVAQKDILAFVDEGMKQIQTFTHKELPKIHAKREAEEHNAAEDILTQSDDQ